MMRVLCLLSHLILTAVLFWQLLLNCCRLWLRPLRSPAHSHLIQRRRGPCDYKTQNLTSCGLQSCLSYFPLSQMKPLHCSKTLWCTCVLCVWLCDLEGPLKTMKNLQLSPGKNIIHDISAWTSNRHLRLHVLTYLQSLFLPWDSCGGKWPHHLPSSSG